MENASGKNAKSCSAFTNVHELSTALDSGIMTIFAFLMTTRSCVLCYTETVQHDSSQNIFP
jgi:hypothetical protein